MGKKRGVQHMVLVGKLVEKGHLGDPGVDGRIILRWIFRKWDVGGMDWIELAQDRDRWRTLVNAVITFGFHKMLGISENRLASQETLCCMK